MAKEQTDTVPAATPVAVIDIGSNGIRMVLAEVAADGHFEVIERTQRAVRLGQDTYVAGRLSGQTMSAAISILSDFRKLLEPYRVDHVRAVATSAVREAANADAFLDRLFLTCGLDVEVIEPSEESRLTVSAVRHALEQAPDIAARRALIADVGGGNALLTVLEDGQIVASGSYRLGSIRLQETLSTAGERPDRAADLIRHQIEGSLNVIRSSLKLKRIQTFIAVGGDARFAAGHVGKKTSSPDLRTIGLAAFGRFVTRCQDVAAEELARKYAMAYGDAETLVPALLVYESLLRATAARKIVVAETSMRDGLLLDLARIVTGQEDEELAAGVLQSARTIGEKYQYDVAHAEHVTDLAVTLFDELRDDHRLTARHRLLLRVAAMLHEVGGFVSNRAHHKHSYYLISNAEIFGLRGGELQQVALIARYHRRGLPKATHPEYIALPRESRVIVSKLAAILRVADALDRGHAQQVRRLDFERTANELIVTVRGAVDLALERRALPKKADLFEDVFGMRVRVEESPLSAGKGKA